MKKLLCLMSILAASYCDASQRRSRRVVTPLASSLQSYTQQRVTRMSATPLMEAAARSFESVGKGFPYGISIMMLPIGTDAETGSTGYCMFVDGNNFDWKNVNDGVYCDFQIQIVMGIAVQYISPKHELKNCWLNTIPVAYPNTNDNQPEARNGSFKETIKELIGGNSILHPELKKRVKRAWDYVHLRKRENKERDFCGVFLTDNLLLTTENQVALNKAHMGSRFDTTLGYREIEAFRNHFSKHFFELDHPFDLTNDRDIKNLLNRIRGRFGANGVHTICICQNDETILMELLLQEDFTLVKENGAYVFRSEKGTQTSIDDIFIDGMVILRGQPDLPFTNFDSIQYISRKEFLLPLDDKFPTNCRRMKINSQAWDNLRHYDTPRRLDVMFNFFIKQDTVSRGSFFVYVPENVSGQTIEVHPQLFSVNLLPVWTELFRMAFLARQQDQTKPLFDKTIEKETRELADIFAKLSNSSELTQKQIDMLRNFKNRLLKKLFNFEDEIIQHLDKLPISEQLELLPSFVTSGKSTDNPVSNLLRCFSPEAFEEFGEEGIDEILTLFSPDGPLGQLVGSSQREYEVLRACAQLARKSSK